jgi:hypothetical protein
VIDKMKSSKLSNQIFKTQNRLFAEDVAFSFFMKELNLRLPSKQRADTIFCDSIPLRNIKMSEVFGFHGLEKREPDLERIILELFQNQKI